MALDRYPEWPDGRTKMIQEIFMDEPWKLLVGCILLNQTSHVQVRKMIWELFERWSTPEDLMNADQNELVEILRPLGFYNRRAKSLKRFAESWLNYPYEIDSLFGIGKYAKDSWEIFINKNTKIEVTDKVLTRYLNEWI